MQITVYTSFSKRKNSTKQPTGGTTVNNVELKKPTSIHEPTFVLGAITGVTMTNITYVKAFGNYYFVTNIAVTPHDYFEISCSEDPMASNKTAILASTQFVMYSASLYNDKLTDTRIQLFPNVTGYAYSATVPFLDENGFYAVTVINYDANNVSTSGLTTTYLMTISDLRALAQYINVDMLAMATSAQDFIEKLRSLLSGAFDYLVSVRYIPLDLVSVATELNLGTVDVYLGPSQAAHAGTAVQGYLLGDDSVVYIEDKLELSALFSADFRCSPTFLKLHAFIPGMGQIDLDPVACKFGFKVDSYIDVLTGDVTTLLYGYPTTYNSDPLLQNSYNYNIGVMFPMAQYSSDTGSVMSGIGGALATAEKIAGGSAGVAGTLIASASAANAIAQGIKPSGSMKGSIAGKSFIKEKFLRLEVEQSYTQNLDIMETTHGRPLMQEVQLSTLSGFCQCANASVELNCMESDRDYVNSCLNSGFYIE